MRFSRSFLAVAFASLSAVACARPNFPDLIPNGRAADATGSGLTCVHLGHEKCVAGAPRNPFGKDFKDIGKMTWTKELCMADSDGDGLTNGEELGDPCCLWTPSNPKPEGYRTTMLSHPGDKADDGAKTAPKCPSGSKPTGPVATTVAATKPADVTTSADVPTADMATTAVVTTVDVTTSAIDTPSMEPSDPPMDSPGAPPTDASVEPSAADPNAPYMKVVNAGSNGTVGTILRDGDRVCTARPFSIVCVVPNGCRATEFYIDNKKTREELYDPFSIAGDSGPSNGNIINPWTTYPNSSTEATVITCAPLDREPLALNLYFGCGPATSVEPSSYPMPYASSDPPSTYEPTPYGTSGTSPTDEMLPYSSGDPSYSADPVASYEAPAVTDDASAAGYPMAT
jgi:hypothetical protein